MNLHEGELHSVYTKINVALRKLYLVKTYDCYGI